MSTTNYLIKPTDGWVQIAAAGATFTRVTGWPHTHPFWIYAGATAPAASNTPVGVAICHKPYINNTTATDNLWARIISPVPQDSAGGAIRLDVITEGTPGGTPTPPEATPFTNAAAGTSTSFTLVGGLYALEAIATWGSLVLNVLGPDGTTFVSISQVQTANGGQVLWLPPGTYQVVSTGGSGYYVTLTQISE